ncbi:MAG: succinate dehydrogenase assembly factor 2 [Gallionellaceae bacterium]|jgi:very-short-patch-repair endonuclease|nr:succinate dehydrogenase assembly factor 2 [Gallionellaceae bacterium]
MPVTKLAFAKHLRQTMTDAERLLWCYLRRRHLGVKFKRQQPMGKYVVDFVCFESRIIVEVDGGQHLESVSDERRDAWLRNQGFAVLRFWNNEVLQQTEAVLDKIYTVCAEPDKSLERLRWRCRRGMLELDIILQRFINQHYPGLNASQRAAFDALLDFPDAELWDMIAGETPPPETDEAVLALLRQA